MSLHLDNFVSLDAQSTAWDSKFGSLAFEVFVVKKSSRMPSLSNPTGPIPSPSPENREQYPERYIFLLLFFVVFFRLVQVLKGYQNERLRREADELDELDADGFDEEDDSDDIASISSQIIPYSSTPGSPSFDHYDLIRSHDIPATPRSGQHNSVTSTAFRFPLTVPSLPTEILRAQKVQHLLTELRKSISLAQQDAESDVHRRRIRKLRRQLRDAMRLDVEYHVPLPSSVLVDSPPPYSDVTQALSHPSHPRPSAEADDLPLKSQPMPTLPEDPCV
ncbi:hypothetical protein CVT26_003367 [Gymnopilus dilepis]|uniref:Uncharacterized protein n=1 Tax=Gymnopilus dilepis TaxID=231916 RepID=A0A409VQP4_9AGAR|nr:hypothetical protein CVT26_003367 [Gymnopilus dilepis]